MHLKLLLRIISWVLPWHSEQMRNLSTQFSNRYNAELQVDHIWRAFWIHRSEKVSAGSLPSRMHLNSVYSETARSNPAFSIWITKLSTAIIFHSENCNRIFMTWICICETRNTAFISNANLSRWTYLTRFIVKTEE